MDAERMSLSHHGNIYRVCFWFRLVSSWYPVDGREPVEEGRGRRGRREEKENENGRGWEKTDRRVGRRDTVSHHGNLIYHHFYCLPSDLVL